jgi:hypothetical protein
LKKRKKLKKNIISIKIYLKNEIRDEIMEKIKKNVEIG